MITKNIGEEFTPEELTGETSRVNNGVSVTIYKGDEPIVAPSLEELKQAKIIDVDANTEDLISQGFTFDGVLFSLSAKAQINWSNIVNIPSQLFPLPINGKNDDGYLLEESDKMNFYYTALNAVNSKLQAGSAKKRAIKACTSIQELEQI